MFETPPTPAARAPLSWTRRGKDTCALTPAKLAARIDTALDRRDQLLFTVTPREELTAFARWQRLADEAWCGLVREVVAATCRMSPTERDFAGDELALALGVAPLTGRALVWEFGAIAALPGLLEAVESGRLSQAHVEACMSVLRSVSLTLEQRQAIVLVAVAEHAGETPEDWARVLRRLVLQVDPQAAERRKAEKTAERRACFYPLADEQGALWLQAPVEQVAQAEARVRAEAQRLKAAGDDRTMDQLMCDLTLALLTSGVLDGRPVAPFEVAVVTPLSVLQGSDETGEIIGWGPVSGQTVRDLAGQAASFSQVTVDDRGQVIAVNDPVLTSAPDLSGAPDREPPRKPAAGLRKAPCPITLDRLLDSAADAMQAPPVIRDLTSSGYRPSRRLRRYLKARDRTCVFPGCRKPAAQTDADHRHPWPCGLTSAENMQCLCRHHHRAKQALFTVEREPDGTVLWTTRGGWVFRRPPRGYH